MRKWYTIGEGRDELLLWLALFNAETEEESEQIKAPEVPEMEQAINAYYKITALPEFREVERLCEKARHDEAQALHHAKMEGREESRAEERIDAIRNLMDTLDLSIEQAMSALKIPFAEQSKYREVLQR